VNKRIQKACQDGGLVSALLAFALENKIIEAAVVSGLSPEKPFYAVPRLITSVEEVLECSGTRYTYSPNMLALKEALKQKRTSLAFVGTPCQIQALRKMELVPLKKYVAPIEFTIGLMCTESFTYEGLIETEIKNKLKIAPEQIKKMNIKGKIIIQTKMGEEKTLSLKEAKIYTRQGCHHCQDFSSELADISAGGLGLTGWTFTVIRTDKGQEIFQTAEKAGAIRTKPVDKEGKPWMLLHMLSRRKRKG
jgi:coenzyme F420 hydrogenase subunit beta